MKFDQFIRPGQEKPLHSNGLVGGVAGSSPASSFEKRQQVHGRRSRIVGRYSDSKLANQHLTREAYNERKGIDSTNQRIDIVKPSREGGAANSGPSRPSPGTPHRFVEPPSRPRSF